MSTAVAMIEMKPSTAVLASLPNLAHRHQAAGDVGRLDGRRLVSQPVADLWIRLPDEVSQRRARQSRLRAPRRRRAAGPRRRRQTTAAPGLRRSMTGCDCGAQDGGRRKTPRRATQKGWASSRLGRRWERGWILTSAHSTSLGRSRRRDQHKGHGPGALCLYAPHGSPGNLSGQPAWRWSLRVRC
jgi:hypothetical protein